MKNTLSTLLCILLVIAMVAGAVCIGAVRGWSGEREAVLADASGKGASAEWLQYRAMDAANLAVVASRHFDNDPDVAALRSAYDTIIHANGNPYAVAQADAAITQAAINLAAKFTQLDLPEHDRDYVYMSTLTRALSEYSSSLDNYTNAIVDYNQRLEESLTGKLAMALGVKPLTGMEGAE